MIIIHNPFSESSQVQVLSHFAVGDSNRLISFISPTYSPCCTRATLNGNNLKVLKGYYLERLFGWWKPQGLQGHQFDGWVLFLLDLALWGWSVLFVGFMQCNQWNHKFSNISEICGSACVDSLFAGEVKQGCKCPYRYGGAFVVRCGPLLSWTARKFH